MSTDVQGGEAAVVETTTAAADQAALSSQDTEIDFEAEARKMGWVPEEEFKGDKRPAKFLSAEEYYRRGEEIIPIIRARNKELEKKLEEQDATFKRMSVMFEKTTARIRAEYEGKIEALKAEKKAAIKAGDADKVERIEAQIDDLKEAAEDGPDATLDKGTAKDQDALTRDFAKANPWYIDEPEMAEYAYKIAANNAGMNPDITFEENMKFVVERVRKKFPNYFKDITETAANGHAAVDTGGNFNGVPPAKGLSSKLNSIELAQAKASVARGDYKNIEEWAKVYYGKD